VHPICMRLGLFVFRIILAILLAVLLFFATVSGLVCLLALISTDLGSAFLGLILAAVFGYASWIIYDKFLGEVVPV
jgi:nicotinamide riboside transporter PnuC